MEETSHTCYEVWPSLLYQQRFYSHSFGSKTFVISANYLKFVDGMWSLFFFNNMLKYMLFSGFLIMVNYEFY